MLRIRKIPIIQNNMFRKYNDTNSYYLVTRYELMFALQNVKMKGSAENEDGIVTNLLKYA